MRLNVDSSAQDAMSAPTVSARFRGLAFGDWIDEGQAEVTLAYTDPVTGLACRCRADLLHPDFTFDLKTSRYALPGPFQRSALEYHYDLQAAMYSYARCLVDGAPDAQDADADTDHQNDRSGDGELAAVRSARPFVFVQVEAEEPHSVHFLVAGQEFVANGRRKYVAALSALAACGQARCWPAPGAEGELGLEPWQAFDGRSHTW